MADYQIGDFKFTLPIWALCRSHRSQVSYNETALDNFVTLQVDGNTCVVLFTHEELAERSLDTLRRIQQLRVDDVHPLPLRTLTGVLTTLAITGAEYVTFDPFFAEKLGGCPRRRPGLPISAVATALIAGQSKTEYAIGQIRFRLPVYLIAMKPRTLLDGRAHCESILECEAGSDRHKYGVLFTDLSLVSAFIENIAKRRNLSDVGCVALLDPHDTAVELLKPTVVGYAFDPDPENSDRVTVAQTLEIVQVLLGATGVDYRIGDFEFQFPVYPLLINSRMREEGDEDRYTGTARVDVSGLKCAVFFTDGNYLKQFAAHHRSSSPGVRQVTPTWPSIGPMRDVIKWLSVNCAIEGVAFDPRTDDHGRNHLNAVIPVRKMLEWLEHPDFIIRTRVAGVA